MWLLYSQAPQSLTAKGHTAQLQQWHLMSTCGVKREEKVPICCKCSTAHAEFVFKVDDDFSNFIEMFTVAVEIARNFTLRYGRCAI